MTDKKAIYTIWTMSDLEISPDFPVMEVLLQQVFGISDFFTNKILMWHDIKCLEIITVISG